VALGEIAKIARLRLQDLVEADPDEENLEQGDLR
jgi:hypothetical protein